MTLLDDAASETGSALVTITHDLAIAARADRQFRLADGVLVPIHLDAPAAVAENATGATIAVAEPSVTAGMTA
jgi:putative ABC transport system ATP-binding protein